MLTLQFDGLFREISGGLRLSSKAGFMCYGWLISRDEVLIARGHGVFARGRDATSNVAEYLALIEGLEALHDLGIKNELVRICGDAKCIIDQMDGAAEVNSPRMKPLYRRAMRLAQNFEHVTWAWTPRKNNRDADQLTRRAMRQMRSDPGGYQAAVQAIHPQNKNRRQTSKFLPLMDLRVYQPLAQPLENPL